MSKYPVVVALRKKRHRKLFNPRRVKKSTTRVADLTHHQSNREAQPIEPKPSTPQQSPSTPQQSPPTPKQSPPTPKQSPPKQHNPNKLQTQSVGASLMQTEQTIDKRISNAKQVKYATKGEIQLLKNQKHLEAIAKIIVSTEESNQAIKPVRPKYRPFRVRPKSNCRKMNRLSYIDNDLSSLDTFLRMNINDIFPQELTVDWNEECLDVEELQMFLDYHRVVRIQHKRTEEHLVKMLEQPMDARVRKDIFIYGSDGEIYQKPKCSYADMIKMALREKGPLSVRAIYAWIRERFTYYVRLDKRRWEAAVRHTLSINKNFEVSAMKTGHGGLWGLATDISPATIKPASVPKEKAETQKHSQTNH